MDIQQQINSFKDFVVVLYKTDNVSEDNDSTPLYILSHHPTYDEAKESADSINVRARNKDSWYPLWCEIYKDGKRVNLSSFV